MSLFVFIEIFYLFIHILMFFEHKIHDFGLFKSVKTISIAVFSIVNICSYNLYIRVHIITYSSQNPNFIRKYQEVMCVHYLDPYNY